MRRSWMRHIAIAAILALGIAACPAEDDEPDAPDVEEPEDVDEPDDTDAPDDEALHIGYILPETGPLAFLGPAQIQGLNMAIDEANDAGGVLGEQVTLSSGDEAGDAGVASESADTLLADGVHAIVGAAASGMSLAIIDQITGAGVVQCSASNTAPTFTDYDDGGYYFRTAPSDALQGPVLAEIVLEDDHTNVALIARADDYGRGLIEATRETLEEAGAEIVYFDTYDPEAVTFDAEVSEILAADPDAVVTVTFEEGVQLIQTLIEQGWDPANTYGADGIRDEGLNESVDPDDANVIDGFKGTAPDPGAVGGFMDSLAEYDDTLDVTVYAPQAYDCGMWIMLAAEAAGSTNPSAISDAMIDVTTGDNECEGFEECAGLLRDGESISYRFVSGVSDMSDVGEPVNGTYEVWEWSDAELTSIDSREVFIEE